MALGLFVFGMAYEIRPVLQCIYDWDDVEETREQLADWPAWVLAMRGQTGKSIEPMGRTAWIVDVGMEVILPNSTSELTTTFMEKFDSLSFRVERRPRGYRMAE